MISMLFDEVREFSRWLGVEPFLVGSVIDLSILLGIVKSICVWMPEWKVKKSKDKNGNNIKTYYHRNK